MHHKGKKDADDSNSIGHQHHSSIGCGVVLVSAPSESLCVLLASVVPFLLTPEQRCVRHRRTRLAMRPALACEAHARAGRAGIAEGGVDGEYPPGRVEAGEEYAVVGVLGCDDDAVGAWIARDPVRSEGRVHGHRARNAGAARIGDVEHVEDAPIPDRHDPVVPIDERHPAAGDRGGQDQRPLDRRLVAVESRREDIFVQTFDCKLNAIDEPWSVRPENLILPDTPVLLAGDGAPRLRPLFDGPEGWSAAIRDDVRFAAGTGFPDAADVARLVASRGMGAAGAAPPQPFYLRPPDVTLPAEKVR